MCGGHMKGKDCFCDTLEFSDRFVPWFIFQTVEAINGIDNMEINEELFNMDEVPDLESSDEEDNVDKIARMRLEEKNRVN